MRLCLAAILLLASTCALWAFQPASNVTRGIYCHPRDALVTTAWAHSGSGVQYVSEKPHGGEACVKCDNSAGGPRITSGVSQSVVLDQDQPRPIKIAGWSKAQNVEPGGAYEYSLYVDLRYTDGTPLYMQIAPFKTGSHDWEYSETIVTPEKPVQSASFHAFVREKQGVVWFDDLFFGEADGENLLKNPGFEANSRVDDVARRELIAQYEDLNANAMHIYLSPNSPIWESDLLDKHFSDASPLDGFLAALRERGIGVWVTTGALSRPFKTVDDANFPAYYCPNEQWGKDWVDVLGDVAKCDIAGLSLVPDEYNYTNGGLKAGFAEHPDEAIRKYYEDMPNYCDGPGCRELFRKTFGADMPDLHDVQQSDAWRQYINFRYMTTTEWIRKGAEAIKAANPECRADSLICVSPVCSDRWWPIGVAWDQLGRDTKIDFLTTDPYILLHNYLGDSNHWYVTETCERLSGAHPQRQCGCVLEASRLRPEYRELDPVEVYGSALSAVFHGAKELAWWHHSHIIGISPTAEDSEKTYGIVKSTYQLLKDVDPWLEDLTPVKRVALLHSRASEDWWHFYSTPETSDLLTHAGKDARYASRAQVEILMHCLRSNIPVDLYYLETVTAEQLADYPLVVVPFPFAISDQQVQVLDDVARNGASLVVMSEFGALTEDGRVRDRPALLDLLGLQGKPSGEQTGLIEPAPGIDFPQRYLGDEVVCYAQVSPAADAEVDATVGEVPTIVSRELGRGGVVFLAGEFGVGLPDGYENEVRSREQRVYPPDYRVTHSEVIKAIYGALLGQVPSVATVGGVSYESEPEFPDDVEVVMATNAEGDLICLCTNWTSGDAPLELAIDTQRFDLGSVEGRQIFSDATVSELRQVPERLASQQACVLRVPRR